MPTIRRLLLALPASLALAACAAGSAVAARPAAPDEVVPWFDATANAVASEGWTAAGNKQVTASRAWALSWSAADQAIGSVSRLRGGRDTAQDAAFVTAVHDALAPTTPSYAGPLDALYERSLDELPDGAAKRAGIAAGAAAARRWLRAREGDGLDVASVNRPYTPPAPALGVWRPTPPTFGAAVQAGQGDARPFVVADVARRYQAAPPPAIDAPVVNRDLEEIVRLGGKEGSQRTPEQTEVARFWSQTSVAGFTSILRGAVATRPLSLGRRVHDVAVFHRVTTDVQIATYKSKYVYLRWRPVTALNTDDGNPRTPYAPGFTPLIDTPLHPEYPSGHTAYAGAAEQVFRTLLGARPGAPIAATSTALPGVVRTYRGWGDATRDNIDGRVWEGIHLRSTDEYGARYGGAVARAVLRADGE